MKSLLSVYHLFKVLDFLKRESLEVCELFYHPGMKAPKDFRYDEARGTLVTPEEIYSNFIGMEVGKVVPHCGRKWVTQIPTERWR